MKKILNSKILLSVLALVLIAAMALGFAACGNKTNAQEPDTTPMQSTQPSSTEEPATQIGQGEKSFTFEVTDKDGGKTVFDIKTDADTVGAALIENKLVSGSESEYGLMVTVVNGETADFNVDGSYWAFYINDEYCNYGIDSQPVADGDSFKIEYTK